MTAAESQVILVSELQVGDLFAISLDQAQENCVAMLARPMEMYANGQWRVPWIATETDQASRGVLVWATRATQRVLVIR
jgi:hypothetical protein